MIIDERQSTAMQFIHAANSGGHRPVDRDVLEWLDRPGFLPGKKGKLISPARPGTPGTPGLMNLGVFAASQQVSPLIQFSEQISEQMRQRMMPVFAESMKGFDSSSGIMRQLYGTPGTPGTPARYAPDGPPENSVEQLLLISMDRGGRRRRAGADSSGSGIASSERA